MASARVACVAAHATRCARKSDELGEAATDADRVVLFDDVRAFVVRFTLPELHYELLCQLVALLGYETAPRRPSSHRLVQDRDDERDEIGELFERLAAPDGYVAHADAHWQPLPRVRTVPAALPFVQRAFALCSERWQLDVTMGAQNATSSSTSTITTMSLSTPVAVLDAILSVLGRRRLPPSLVSPGPTTSDDVTTPLDRLRASLSAVRDGDGARFRASQAAQALLHFTALPSNDAAVLRNCRRVARRLLGERRDDIALCGAFADVEARANQIVEVNNFILFGLIYFRCYK